jgi:cytochrome c oxidase cbb3-type subunit 3
MAGTPEKDAISGQSTTGHEWDGIKELNTPLPKWWVYVFYVTILWSFAYWVVYPSWPGGSDFFAGYLGYNSRIEVGEEIAQAKAKTADLREAVAAKDVDGIAADPSLRQYAMAGGQVLFKENCVPCHQSGGAGALGFPTLADDEWLWGGDLDSIQTTITDGIRSDLSDATRLSEMPAFGDFLPEDDISAVADYVLSMAQGNPASGPGQDLFVEQCAVCHSSDGMNPVSDGNDMLGAPALGNQVWLYTAPGVPMEKADVVAQVTAPKHGVMPAWGGRLAEEDIKMLAVYVHSLGGGQ